MPFARIALAALFTLCAGTASPFETARYKSLVGQTISAINSGDFEVGELVSLQRQFIAIGVRGARDFGSANSEYRALMTMVENSANDMTELTLDEIEAAWHEGEAITAIGLDFDAIDHFGPAISHMDAVIHPATAIIALREYEATEDEAYLDQVIDELSEVIEHISHLN